MPADASRKRWRLDLGYDGTAFSGWAAQAGQRTVQGELQLWLARVLEVDQQPRLVCAGRTDSGVHAECQVVHFDSEAPRTPRSWSLGTTTRLPPSVCVRWCVPVADDFHARFSARADEAFLREIIAWHFLGSMEGLFRSRKRT